MQTKKCIHTHTHIWTHKDTYTNIHIYTYSMHTHTKIHIHVDTPIHAYIHIAYTHTQKHRHLYTCICALVHTHVCTPTLSHTHIFKVHTFLKCCPFTLGSSGFPLALSVCCSAWNVIVNLPCEILMGRALSSDCTWFSCSKSAHARLVTGQWLHYSSYDNLQNLLIHTKWFLVKIS
jgi:hypothetical protein